MKLNVLTPLILTAVLTLVGYYLVHRLSEERERYAKQRDLRAGYLMKCYRTIAALAGKVDIDEKKGNLLRQAFFDIQLFGTPEEINLAKTLAKSFVDNPPDGGRTLDPLLNALRNDLRESIGLSPMSGPIWNCQFLAKGREG